MERLYGTINAKESGAKNLANYDMQKKETYLLLSLASKCSITLPQP